MYEVLAGLLPYLDSLYSDKATSQVIVDGDMVLRGMADSAKKTLDEFEYSIMTYRMSETFAAEGIHPLTKYVMDYISALTGYHEILDSLLNDHCGETPMPASSCTSSGVEEGSISGSTCDFSPIAQHFLSDNSILKWLSNGSSTSPSSKEESISGGTCKLSPMALQFQAFCSILESQLYNKAKLLKDASLKHVFLMNNMHYMVQTVENSQLQFILGEEWIREHNLEFQHHVMNYKSVRRDAFDEFLEMENLSIEDVRKLKWDSLSSKIRRWVRNMKIFVRVYLASEKCLFEQIFGDLGTVNLLSFTEASMLRLLNFGEALSIGPSMPEKLFLILDMYEVLADLLADIDSLYADEAGARLRINCREVLRRFGDSVRASFLRFEIAFLACTLTNPFAGGGILPLTRYVMCYLHILTGHRETLNFLLKDHDGEDAVSLSPDITPSTEEENTREGARDGSPLALHFISVASNLECNLDEQARQYRDASLQHIFMMNNIHYMVQKVVNSDLQSIFGDRWIRRHRWKCMKHAINYEKTTWSSIVAILVQGDSISLTLLKERLRNFYIAFEEVYRTQTVWSIPYVPLREDLRNSISLKVIQAYRTFVGRHENLILDKHFKYSADDLQNYLLDLFEGPRRSLHNPTGDERAIDTL